MFGNSLSLTALRSSACSSADNRILNFALPVVASSLVCSADSFTHPHRTPRKGELTFAATRTGREVAETLTQLKTGPGNWRGLHPEIPSVRSAPYYSRPRETAKSTPLDPEKCTTPLGGPSKRARTHRTAQKLGKSQGIMENALITGDSIQLRLRLRNE